MAQPGYEHFAACDTASDDVCLIAFTSGTTGVPKGTMHFHRDMLAICDTFGKYVLRAEPDDRFIGSPPIAFTFGLGGLVLFPLRVGAAAILLESAAPDDLPRRSSNSRHDLLHRADRLPRHARQARRPRPLLAAQMRLRRRDAAGARRSTAWQAATGIRIIDGLGSTEMLHIFIGSPEDDDAAGRDRKAGARLRGARHRRGRPRSAARHARPARRARPDRLPLSRRQAPDATMCSTAGTSPATPISTTPTAISAIRRAPTT